jgi:WD40 repeat protein
MPDLFISYARGDSRDFVARLSAALEERGQDTWVDLEDIPPASSWNEDLRAGIAASDSFCFVISPASVGSPHCRAELDHAVALGKRILPVLHLEVPDAEVPEPVATRNWIPQLGRFTDDFDTSLATLVSAIETDLDWVREHTRWGLRAEEWERRGEDRSLVARGSDLDQAEAFIGGGGNRDPAPTELQGRYVVASRRAATRRQRQLVTGVSIALVVAIVLGVLALLQRNTAVDQKHQAEDQRAKATSRALAANAFLNLPTDPELSVLLGLEAAKASPTIEAESALRSGILDDRLRATLQHTDKVYDASFSPDGSRIVTASEDHTAALWDANTHQKVADLEGATQAVFEARWSADGSRVVSRSDDGTVHVWDGHTGAAVSTITDTDDPRLSDVVITANGSQVVTSGFVGNKVRVWNATDGSLTGTIPRKNIGRMALSPDDSYLALAGDSKVEVWSLADLRLLASYPAGQDGPSALAFSPDGQHLGYGYGDGTATVRSPDGSVDAQVHHDGPIDALAFSPDGTLLATASDDGTARVTRLDGDTLLASYTGHQGPVRAIAFAPDGSEVASGGDDGHVDLWRSTSGALVTALVGHATRVNSVAFAPDGASLVSGSDDGTARVWTTSPSGGAFKLDASVRIGDEINDTFSSNGRFGVFEDDSGNRDSYQLRTVDVASGEISDGFALSPAGYLVQALSPDGLLVPVSTGDGVDLHRTSDGSVAATLDATGANAADFSPDGKRIAVVGTGGTAAVFDAGSGLQEQSFTGVHADFVAVAFSPDGDRLATLSTDGAARVWDVDSGKQLQQLAAVGPMTPNSQPLGRVLFSPDGKRLLTSATWETGAKLWDLTSGEQVSALQGITAGVFGAGFSPSGRFIVTAGYLGNVRLWDGQNGRLLTDITGDTTGGFAASFGQDDRTVELMVGTGEAQAGELRTYTCDACGDVDSLVKLAKTRVTRKLTATERATYLTDE